MKEEKYRDGQVVVREGDPGDCMYYIRWGSVGVFTKYGTKSEEKLAELRTGDYFGEMGLLEQQSRSATVVSLDHETTLNRISESEFAEFLQENPAKVMDILKGLSHKLRATTRNYLELCDEVGKSVGSETNEIDESTNYGFAENDQLKAMQSDTQAPTAAEV